MWANSGRRKHFTAANSTNNRLKATWKQMKSMLNLTCGLDQCLAAVIQYQNGSMAELRKELVEKHAKSYYDETEPDEISDLGNALSDFSFKFVRGVYIAYQRQQKKLGTKRITRDGVDVIYCGEEYRVQLDHPSCSCSEFLESRILCIYICYVALQIKKLDTIPVKMIPDRWNFSEATDLLPSLRRSMLVNKVMWRKLIDRSPRDPAPVVSFGSKLSPEGNVRRVAYVKLKKNQRSSEGTLVRSDVEKYNIAMATLKPVVDALVQSSTVEFYPKMRLLEAAATNLLRVFANSSANESDSNRGDNSTNLLSFSGACEVTLPALATSPNKIARQGSPSDVPQNSFLRPSNGTTTYELSAVDSREQDSAESGESSGTITAGEDANTSPGATPPAIFAASVSLPETSDAIRKSGAHYSSDSTSSLGEVTYSVESTDRAITLSNFAQSNGTTQDSPAGVVDGEGAARVAPLISEDSTQQSSCGVNDTQVEEAISGLVDLRTVKIGSVVSEATLQVAVSSDVEIPPSPINYQEVKQLTSAGFLRILKLPPAIHSGKKNNQRRRNSTKQLVHPRIEVVVAIEDWKRGVNIKDVAVWLEYSRDQSLVTAVLKKTPIVLNRMIDIKRKVVVLEDD